MARRKTISVNVFPLADGRWQAVPADLPTEFVKACEVKADDLESAVQSCRALIWTMMSEVEEASDATIRGSRFPPSRKSDDTELRATDSQ